MSGQSSVAADGPVLVFGGPCSNLEATEAVLAEAARRGIPAERVVCTGDVVAYGADPRATVAAVRRAGVRVVAGSCEEQLARGAGDLLSAAWHAHARRELGPIELAWMGGLPRRLEIEVNGLRLAVVHGGAAAVNRFLFASTPARVKAMEIDVAGEGVDGVVAGHCGLPMTQAVGGRLWHNPGAVGMPANDGTPRVWCSVLSPGRLPRTLVVEHVPLAYDHGVAAGKMRAAGLPEGYADALATGLWPSCDVLPPAELKAQGVPLVAGTVVWRRDAEGADAVVAWPAPAVPPRLDPAKFRDAAVTAKGERRAVVALERLATLWINTGTLCNLACANCYIESSPKNDRLAYITAAEVREYLDEIGRDGLGTEEIGFTGGEPFMNRELPAMLEDALQRGFRVMVLTNAMRPMRRFERQLLALRDRHGDRLTLRVSVDHYAEELHELERGPRSWKPTIDGLRWLAAGGFALNVAGRLYSGEPETVVRAGYARLFAGHGLPVDASDPVQLVLFPEMDASVDVPEITEACWGILGKSPASVMCASSRMVVKRKGAEAPAVLACTLLVDDPAFELGRTLAEAAGAVPLNHPHCAKFCVLGGAACSKG